VSELSEQDSFRGVTICDIVIHNYVLIFMLYRTYIQHIVAWACFEMWDFWLSFSWFELAAWKRDFTCTLKSCRDQYIILKNE